MFIEQVYGALGVWDERLKKQKDVLLEINFGQLNKATFKILKPDGINYKQQYNFVSNSYDIGSLSQAFEQESKRLSNQYPYEIDYFQDEREVRETLNYICNEYQKMVEKTRKVTTILIDRQDNLKKATVKVRQIKQYCMKDTKYLTEVYQKLENCEQIATKQNEKNQDLQNIFELDPLSDQIIDLQAQILTYKDALLIIQSALQLGRIPYENAFQKIKKISDKEFDCYELLKKCRKEL